MSLILYISQFFICTVDTNNIIHRRVKPHAVRFEITLLNFTNTKTTTRITIRDRSPKKLIPKKREKLRSLIKASQYLPHSPSQLLLIFVLAAHFFCSPKV